MKNKEKNAQKKKILIAFKKVLLDNKADLTDKIENLIKEWQPELLVVGLPLDEDGGTHKMTALCKRFANRLNGRFSLSVILVDERYSSAEASQQLNQQNIKGRKQKPMLDAMAAQVILQSYFDSLPEADKITA